MKKILLLLAIAFAFSISQASAASVLPLNLQGIVTEDGNPIEDGNYTLNVSLYDYGEQTVKETIPVQDVNFTNGFFGITVLLDDTNYNFATNVYQISYSVDGKATDADGFKITKRPKLAAHDTLNTMKLGGKIASEFGLDTQIDSYKEEVGKKYITQESFGKIVSDLQTLLTNKSEKLAKEVADMKLNYENSIKEVEKTLIKKEDINTFYTGATLDENGKFPIEMMPF